jgi:hypothetical protein
VKCGEDFSENIGEVNHLEIFYKDEDNIYYRNMTNRGYLQADSQYFIIDREATLLTPLKPLKSNVDIKGPGKITLVNGSNVVTGIDTSFEDTDVDGVGYWYRIHIKDSAGNWFSIYVDQIQSDTALTIMSCHDRASLRAGYFVGMSTTFNGVSGTYDYWILRNWSDGLASHAFGNGCYADNYGFAFGGSCIVTGQTGFASGFFTYVSGAQAFALGQYTHAKGAKSFAGGWGTFAEFESDKRILASGQTSFNFSQNTTSQTVGHGARAATSAILGGQNHDIDSASIGAVILGGNAIKVPSGKSDYVHVQKFSVGGGKAGNVLIEFWNAFRSTLNWNPTAVRTLTIPDVSGSLPNIVDVTGGKKSIVLSQLPTSSAGLASGTLWNNSGVVNVVP